MVPNHDGNLNYIHLSDFDFDFLGVSYGFMTYPMNLTIQLFRIYFFQTLTRFILCTALSSSAVHICIFFSHFYLTYNYTIGNKICYTV